MFLNSWITRLSYAGVLVREFYVNGADLKKKKKPVDGCAPK